MLVLPSGVKFFLQNMMTESVFSFQKKKVIQVHLNNYSKFNDACHLIHLFTVFF